MRNSTFYEQYIYEAIEGFEIDDLIKPKIEAAKGNKERMQALYYAVEKLIRNQIKIEDLNSI